jgi:hypothetical protein
MPWQKNTTTLRKLKLSTKRSKERRDAVSLVNGAENAIQFMHFVHLFSLPFDSISLNLYLMASELKLVCIATALFDTRSSFSAGGSSASVSY